MRWFQLLLFVFLAAATASGGVAQAGSTLVQGAGGTFNLNVTSLKELRWKNVIRQQYDFSCGSAAVGRPSAETWAEGPGFVSWRFRGLGRAETSLLS